MRIRRPHVIATMAGIGAVLVLIAAVVLPSVYLDRNPRALLELKTDIHLPAESAVEILGRSDGGFQNDFITIYLIRSDDQLSGTMLDPAYLSEPVEGDLSNHLRDLTLIVTGEGALDSRTPTRCKTIIPSSDHASYEAIVCGTENDSEWLVYETNS